MLPASLQPVLLMVTPAVISVRTQSKFGHFVGSKMPLKPNMAQRNCHQCCKIVIANTSNALPLCICRHGKKAAHAKPWWSGLMWSSASGSAEKLQSNFPLLHLHRQHTGHRLCCPSGQDNLDPLQVFTTLMMQTSHALNRSILVCDQI